MMHSRSTNCTEGLFRRHLLWQIHNTPILRYSDVSFEDNADNDLILVIRKSTTQKQP